MSCRDAYIDQLTSHVRCPGMHRWQAHAFSLGWKEGPLLVYRQYVERECQRWAVIGATASRYVVSERLFPTA